MGMDAGTSMELLDGMRMGESSLEFGIPDSNKTKDSTTAGGGFGIPDSTTLGDGFPEMGMDAGTSMDILGGSMPGGSKVPDSTTLGGSFGSTTTSGGSSTSTWDGTSVCVDNTNPDDSV
jgi:hypothetical protein